MSVIRSIGHIKPRKRVAVVDVDEVLFPFIGPFLKWSRVKPTAEKHSNSISKIMNTSEHYTQNRINRFIHSEYFEYIEPIKHSHQGLAYLRENGYKIYATSGRQNINRQRTEYMLDTYFPYLVDDLLLSNKYSDRYTSKLNLYHSVGADLIVNDNIDTCNKSTREGINAINFIGDPVYPWCSENPHSARSWIDVIGRVHDIWSRNAWPGSS